jgi:L-amino acid N-acyltransferase YncA
MPLIRPSRDEDIAEIARIYAHHVLHGTGTFETTPHGRRHGHAPADVLGKGLPWLVAEVDGPVLGFAYGNWFKPRPAYRFSVEDSIYLDPAHAGPGPGPGLAGRAAGQAGSAGVRKAMAVIGDSANAGSIGVHRAWALNTWAWWRPAAGNSDAGWTLC